MSRELKDSGIAWIGEIPKGWNICRIKDVICLYTGNSIKDEEKDIYTDKLDAYPYISTKDIDVVYYTINYDNGLYTKKDDILFKNADIGSSLVCIEGGSAGKKKAFVEQKISFVNKLCCFAPKNINGKYSFYHLCSSNFEFQFNKFVTGLIGGVSVSVLKNFIMILPPLLEQQKIAEFLDRKCGEIDELVALQEKMIEELKAYKQSVITEAVTKGLNPNAPMKDSGIAWIGEIPEHWEMYRIKYNTFLKGRIGWQGLNSSDFIDEGYCLITGTDFDNKGGIVWERCYRISKERFYEDTLLHVKQGDLLMTKDGTVGKMAYISELPEEASLNSHLLIIRQTTDQISNKFLYWTMLSDVFKRFCSIYQSGSIMNSISQTTLGMFCYYSPTLPEQQAIVDYIDRKCAEIDELVAVKQQKIETLKEYKKSLIYEYVTGKKEII